MYIHTIKAHPKPTGRYAFTVTLVDADPPACNPPPDKIHEVSVSAGQLFNWRRFRQAVLAQTGRLFSMDCPDCQDWGRPQAHWEEHLRWALG
jgi:hypothetical protein